MQAFDGSAVIVALPAIAKVFGVPALSLNLVITSYLIGATALLPVCGWAAERFGARTMFLVAVALFGASSLACGLATGLGWLIVARLVQGSAGALLLPVGRMIVLGSAPKADFVRAVGLLTMPVMLGPLLGPPLGGLIVTVASWRWLFLVNVPIALVGLVLVWRFVPDIAGRRVRPLDWRGLLLLSLALIATTYGIGLASRPTVAPLAIVAIIAGGIACGAGYAWHARRHPDPILDFGLLRIPTFGATNVGGLFQRMLVSAIPFLLVLLFQVGFGLTPLEAGGLIFASALGSASGRPLLERALRRWGFRRLLTINSCAIAATIGACALLTASTPHVVIMALLFVQGMLRSLQLISLMTLSYADTDPRDIGAGSTIASLSQQAALSLGIAVSVIAVQVSQSLGGAPTLDAATIAPVFVVLALLSLVTLLWIRRLPPEAGALLAQGRDNMTAVSPEEAAV